MILSYKIVILQFWVVLSKNIMIRTSFTSENDFDELSKWPIFYVQSNNWWKISWWDCAFKNGGYGITRSPGIDLNIVTLKETRWEFSVWNR